MGVEGHGAFLIGTCVISCADVCISSCFRNSFLDTLPFLQKVLETKHELNLSLKQVENVLWKIETFLPCMVSVSHPLGQNPFQLKKYQELVPDVPTVCVPSLVTSCACCGGALEDKAGRSSSRLVNNLRGSDEMDNRFLIFTQAAGVLFAEFKEGFCSACRLYFLGCWQYEKKAGAFHHMDKLHCCGLQADVDVFAPRASLSLHALCFH